MHPLKPERLKRTFELLTAYRAFDTPNSRLVAPVPASREELLLFHTAEYVDAVARLRHGGSGAAARRYGFRPDETPVFPGMYESEGLKVGAALTAARLIVEGQVRTAFSFAGGMHHARQALASGFCVFNDAAVARACRAWCIPPAKLKAVPTCPSTIDLAAVRAAPTLRPALSYIPGKTGVSSGRKP